MSDLRLNESSYDLDVVNGDLSLIENQDAIRQNIRQRLLLFLGEWFLDTAAGVPYYQDVLKKSPNPQVLQGVFQDAIFNTPGVLELLSYEQEYDPAERTLQISFSVRTETGNIDFTEILEV